MLNNNLVANNNHFKFSYDSTSQKYGYTIPVGGADTFYPFKEGNEPFTTQISTNANLPGTSGVATASNTTTIQNLENYTNAHVVIGTIGDTSSGSNGRSYSLKGNGSTVLISGYAATTRDFDITNYSYLVWSHSGSNGRGYTTTITFS